MDNDWHLADVLWFASGSDYRVGLWSGALVKGGCKRGRCSYASSSQHACSLEEWMCNSCSWLSPVSLHLGSCCQVFFIGSLHGNWKDKTRAHLRKGAFNQIHSLSFYFGLVIWHLFKIFISVLGLSHTWGKVCCGYIICIGKLNLRMESACQCMCRSWIVF